MPQVALKSQVSWDSDKFRLRRLVERLIAMGEVDIHDEPVPLSRFAGLVEATTKAVLGRNVGPEHLELVASVTGTRRGLAAAFGVPEDKMREEFARRMANPQNTFEVPGSEAPVQEVVLTGDKVDLTKLPFHIQHEFDGAPYISSGIDFSYDPATKRSNVGCRRLMLRDRTQAGFNLTAPSDLKAIYLACVARGERLQASFTIGSHPLDTMAAASKSSGQEIDALATLRGEPMAVVKCLTNDVYVPADAEIVLEGYIDERGYIDPEGPYGEYMGYYGPMHGDPVFHVTAVTHRKDVLHQSVKHGVGRALGDCDSAPMVALTTENRAWNLLRQAGLKPRDAYVFEGSGSNLRVSITKASAADARIAIATLLGNMRNVKHVFVTDDDIDIRSHAEMEWAMATRFQADTDIVTLTNMQRRPMDPSAQARGSSTKAGFDLTFPYPRGNKITDRVPSAPRIAGPARFQTVRQALESEPMHFAKLISVLGSDDGRELTPEVNRLMAEGVVERNSDGEYFVKKG